MAEDPICISSAPSCLAAKLFFNPKLSKEFGETFGNDHAHESSKDVLKYNAMVVFQIFGVTFVLVEQFQNGNFPFTEVVI